MRARHDRQILRLAVPALGALAAEPLYVLVDTAVVGHLGTAQLGGLAVAATILTTGFWLFSFLAYGTTASVARAVGAGDRRGAAAYAVQGLWFALVIGGALAVLGVVGARAAVGAMGAEGTVREHAITYLSISALGAPAVLVTLVGMGYSRGLQDTRTPFAIALVANAANLGIELVLIYRLGWDIEASAWSTVVAQTGAALVYLGILRRTVRAQHVRLRPDPVRMRAAAVMGGHLLVRTGSLLASFTLATAIATRIGAVPLGAHQIAFQVWMFLALVLDAIAIAGQAMTGAFLGAGEPGEARTAARRMIGWGVAAGIVFAIAVVAARPVLPALFTDDPAVRALAHDVLLVVAALQPLGAVVFVLDGVLIGAGDARFLAGAMAVAFAVFLPMALGVLASGGGLLMLWAAITVLMLVRFAGVMWRFAGERWAVVGDRSAA